MSETAPVLHVRDLGPRPRLFTIWERKRNTKEVHWLMECFAEALGVFFYVYFGLGSQVGWVFGNLIKQEGISSVFQIGMAYTFGIVFAITVCASTSGGHFNPCVSIALVIFKGFPPLKALRYIIAQVLGSFVASLVVYNQWKAIIDLAETTVEAATPGVIEAILFTPNGPAGAFGNYMLPGQTLPRIFMNEFMNCTLLGIIIWTCLDPSKIVLPPVASTFVVAFSYGAAIWGFAVPGVSLNAARDVGARLGAMVIWGRAAGGGSYAAIAALTNIPATLFGAFLYEIFLVDSDAVVSAEHIKFIRHHQNHARHSHELQSSNRSNYDAETASTEKPNVTTYENSPSNSDV